MVVASGTKPLPELMLTHHQLGPVAFIWWQFHKRYQNHQSLKSASNLLGTNAVRNIISPSQSRQHFRVNQNWIGNDIQSSYHIVVTDKCSGELDHWFRLWRCHPLRASIHCLYQYCTELVSKSTNRKSVIWIKKRTKIYLKMLSAKCRSLSSGLIVITTNKISIWVVLLCINYTWWRQMKTLSALLTLCAGNSPITGEFPAQRPVTRSFDIFFDMRLNKRLSKQGWGW